MTSSATKSCTPSVFGSDSIRAALRRAMQTPIGDARRKGADRAELEHTPPGGLDALDVAAAATPARRLTPSELQHVNETFACVRRLAEEAVRDRPPWIPASDYEWRWEAELDPYPWDDDEFAVDVEPAAEPERETPETSPRQPRLRLIHALSEHEQLQPTRRELLRQQLDELLADLTPDELEEAAFVLKAIVTEGA